MNSNTSRILAIDFGLAKTGLAMTSASIGLALPLKTIRAKGPQLWIELERVMKEYAPSTVLIGLPLLMNGQDSQQTTLTRAFIASFTQRFTDCEVIAFDERLSSKQAERLLQERGLNRKERAQANDETSAWIMLTCYLEKRSLENERLFSEKDPS